MKKAKKPIVLSASKKLDTGVSSPSHPAKIAATRPTHPTHFGASFVFRIANA